jgi:hypothetical protein
VEETYCDPRCERRALPMANRLRPSGLMKRQVQVIYLTRYKLITQYQWERQRYTPSNSGQITRLAAKSSFIAGLIPRPRLRAKVAAMNVFEIIGEIEPDPNLWIDFEVRKA